MISQQCFCPSSIAFCSPKKKHLSGGGGKKERSGGGDWVAEAGLRIWVGVMVSEKLIPFAAAVGRRRIHSQNFEKKINKIY